MNIADEEYWTNLDSLSLKLRDEAAKLKVSALLSLLYTADVVNHHIRNYLKQNIMDINQDEISVLHQLVLNRGTMSPTEISKKILRSKYNVSRLINRLNKQDLIIIAPWGIDNRKKEITITKKGLDLVHSLATEGRVKISSEILSSLGEEEIIIIKQILRKIRKNVFTLDSR